MHQKHNIAVLLAAHNGEKWLSSQINSIFSQENVRVQLFISVDLSSDDTQKLTYKISQANAGISIISADTIFGSAKENFCHLLKKTSFRNFEYVAFADQDDIWQPNKLQHACAKLTETSSEGYSSNVTAFWPNGKKKLIRKSQPQVAWDYLFESAGPGCTFVITQKLAVHLKEFIINNEDEMKKIWLHDWFIYAFARSHSYKWHIDNYSSLRYRQHENNLVGANIGYKSFLYRVKFVLSGKALKQAALLAHLCGLENKTFVKRWRKLSRFGMLYLAINAGKCRRKFSEKFTFAASCIILFFLGNKKDG